MKTLNQLMQEVFFKDGPVEILKGIPDYFLPSVVLKEDKIKKLILNTVEFQDVEELIIPDDEQTWSDHKTMKIDDGVTKFEGKISLCSIGLTPTMFNPDDLYTPVKNGVVVTPPFFDKNTLKPTRKVVIEYEYESLMDDITLNSPNGELEKLKQKLEDAVTNHQEYKPIGYKGVLVRFKQLEHNK